MKAVVQNVLMLDGGGTDGQTFIASASFDKDAPDAGAAGNVLVTAGSLQVLRGARVSGAVQGGGSGGSVNVTVTAANLSIVGGADISASTFGTGAGGTLNIKVSQLTNLDDGTGIGNTGLFATTQLPTPGGGPGGSIQLSTGDLMVLNGAKISGSTTGTGAGGDVTVNVSGMATINGNGRQITTGLGTDTESTSPGGGKAGDLTVTAGNLSILNGAAIASTAFGTGAAGDINLKVNGTFSAAGTAAALFTGVESATHFAAAGGGNAGKVIVAAGALSLLGGAQISTTSFGTGSGGEVDVNVPGSVSISGGLGMPAGDQSAIESESQASPGGNAGDISVTSGKLSLSDGGRITSASTGSANADNVKLTADEINLAQQAKLSVSATTPGSNAGDETLVSRDDIHLTGHSTVSATAAGTGGNISLTAPNLIFVSASSITAKAGGAGGLITIDPPVVVLSDGSVIDGLSASKPRPVIIDAAAFLVSSDSRILTVEPRFTVDDTVASTIGRLPGGVASSGVTLADQCGVVFTTGNISSFVVTGRGGTPVEPGGWSPSVDLVDGSAMTSDQKRKDMGAR